MVKFSILFLLLFWRWCSSGFYVNFPVVYYRIPPARIMTTNPKLSIKGPSNNLFSSYKRPFPQ